MADLAGAEGVSVLVTAAENARVERVARLRSLRPVAVAWDQRGRQLAFAQDELYGVWRGEPPVIRSAATALGGLVFDAAADLWALGGGRQWRAAAEDGFIAREQRDGVAAATIAPAAALLAGPAGLEVRCTRAGRPLSVPWPLAVSQRPRLRASDDGLFLVVGADEPSGPGRTRLELARIDLESGLVFPLFSGEVATGLGWQTPAWHPWIDGSCLVVLELDGYAALFAIDRHARVSQRLSPDGFEVSEFAPAAASGRVAITAAPPPGRAAGATWLLLWDSAGEDAALLREGVNALPAWDRRGERLFHVHSPALGMTKVCVVPASATARTKAPDGCTAPRAPAGELVLPATGTACAALIYLAGPHRRLVNGPQATFHHHALTSLAARLAAEGATAVCLNPAGSTGNGRAYREPSRPWSLVAADALSERIRALRASGIERIGVLAGSLGALPVLRVLRADTLAAAVLVSPVYNPQIPSLQRWQHLFDEVVWHSQVERIACAISTPIMVVHGLRDEMTASGDSSRFVSHVAREVPCEYLTLVDEGHIFARTGSWTRVLGRAWRFLQAHLMVERAG